MDFVLVRDSVSGKNVAINPYLVRFLYEIDERRVNIVFDMDHSVVVDGRVAALSEHFKRATR